VRALVIQLLESLKAEFVFSFFILDVAKLFELVVANLQLPAVDQLIMHKLNRLLSLVRRLKANKCISFLHLIDRKQFDAFYFSIVFEHFAKVFVSASWIKVFDVQVAALL